jgi:hypothetical protein
MRIGRIGVVVLTLALVLASTASAGAGTAASSNGNQFPQPLRIDNQWFPLVPGTQVVFEGRINHGETRVPHRVVFTVTGLTKVIDGVRTRVLWDRDFNSGELAESELTFHAQDRDGNVWNFGEYPEQYKNGKLRGAPDTWIAGQKRSEAGIVMLGNPRVGTDAYVQGFSPTIDFLDKAQVSKTGQSDCVPIGCFDNVLVTREWSGGEFGDFQLKYYAPGIGGTRVGFSGDDPDQEELVLIKVVHLTRDELAKLDDSALRLDHRAYVVAPDMYGATRPAK